MVNTKFNGIRLIAPVNAHAKESTAGGRGRGSGRGRGRGRVAPVGDGAPVDNASVNDNSHSHHEDIDENVANVGQEGIVQAEAENVPPLDPLLAK